MNKLPASIIEAHGGLSAWEAFDTVGAHHCRRRGIFPFKGLPVDEVPHRVTVQLHEERASLAPYGAIDQRMRSLTCGWFRSTSATSSSLELRNSALNSWFKAATAEFGLLKRKVIMGKASTVLLIHGAWANASCWSRVIPLIERFGLAATAVQLPLTSLDDDVAAVRRAIALEAGPVLLVGHSYGGVVITEAGTDQKVAGLVYIAAFAPDVGQSAGSLGAAGEPPPMSAEIRPDPQGFLKLTRVGVNDGFAQDLPEVEKSLLFATQAPTAAQALGGVVSTPAWKTKPSWYLVATEDRAIQPDLEREMAEQIGAQTVSVSASHLAMLSHPEDVAKLIFEAAA